MKVKHLTAKLSALTLSALLFALLWGWIASTRVEDQSATAPALQASAPAQLAPVAAAPPPTPETVIRRMVVVRTRNADGTVTERVVPETEYVPATAPQPVAPQPVARSRGS